MEEWKEYKLEEISYLSTGFPFKGNKYSKDGIRVVRGDNVTIGQLRWDAEKDKRWNEFFERESEFSLRANDIVIGMDGSRVGMNRAQIKESDLPLLLAQRVACVRNNDKSVQKFLYYHIFSKRFVDYVKAIHTGTSIPHISLKQIGDFTIQLPSLAIQQKIANILSSLDDKIEVNRRINEQLEELAGALFKSWFVDFEPFKDGEFVESELGMIPKGWKVGTFSNVVDSTLGGDWGKENEQGNYTKEVFCIRGADIPEIKIGNRGKMPIRYILEKNFAKKSLANNDLVVEISGGSPTQSTGRVCRVTSGLLEKYNNSLICTNFCRAIKPFAKYSTYIYYYWQYLYDQGTMFNYENGTTGIKNLMINDILDKEPIVVPPINIVEQYKDVVETFATKIQKNGEEIEKLTTLRDTLLPKLMSGEIDVK